jgi:signal peptidase II
MKNKKLFLTAILIFIFDRITKWVILSHHVIYFPVFKNYLSLSSVVNTGAAFSLFQNHQFFLIIVSSLAIIFFVYYFSKKNVAFLPQLAWGCLLGGALGNLFDRISYKCVVDFINLEFLKFPIFNVADVAISVGAFFLFYYFLFAEGKNDA